jgi:2'-5' RNA ligase
MKYLVAIPIPEPWLSKLIQIKSDFRPDGWRDTMDPHITVLAPDQPLLDPERAAKAFGDTTFGIRPFDVQFRRIERFSRRQLHTLVLRPDPEAPLTQLFQAVVAKCTWQSTKASTKREHVSHITIANQLPNALTGQAEARIKALRLNVSFRCDKLTLYAKQAKWPQWQPLATRQLK